MKSTIIFAVFFLSILCLAQSHKLVQINNINPSVLTQIQRLGIDLENAEYSKDGSMRISVSPEGFEKLQQISMPYTVIINDLSAYYRQRPQLSASEKTNLLRVSKEQYGVEGFGFGSMGGYYTFAEIVANLDSMLVHYPNLITPKFTIGNSHEGRAIWAVKISDNPTSSENEPHVYYDALIHAREPQSMAVVMYYMWYLLENYGTNPEVTYLVNNREMYFVPCFNPDGYEYNHQTDPQGGGMWRLNRRVNGNGTYGVDLNRNFGYKWGFDNVGSSGTPGDETYRGPSAFSEPEPQSVRNFLNTLNVKTYINYHSYNNSIIYPWGYANAFTPDSATFVEYASYMVQHNGYDYGNSYQTLGYVSNGTARDWGYGEQETKGKAYSYTFEVGGSSDGFWPAQSRILPLAQGNLRPNLFQAWIAGGYPLVDGKVFSRPYFMPNDTASVAIRLKNKGLSPAYNIQVTATSISNGLSILSTGGIMVDSLPARGMVNSAPVYFQVGAGVTANTRLKMVLTTSMAGLEISKDTIGFVVGMPTYLILDSANNINNLWTVTASPVTPKWEVTNTASVSSPNSYTDSKTGQYANSATVTMLTTNTINLTGYATAKLNYSLKWDIEKKWDCLVAQVSTDNGSTWTSLTGAFTVPASGSGKQIPAGMPCYDGTQSNWVNESIDLSAYANKQIKLKFELRTDGSQTRDGVFLDDIGIVVYTLQQQPTLTWNGVISVSDADANTSVSFGTSSTATDGIDVALGEVTLPPLPPTGVFDVRFELPVVPAEFSAKDYRRDTLQSVDWLLRFQPGIQGYPITLTWNPATLPAGTFTMKDNITGTLINVDMKAQGQLVISNSALGAVKIEYRRQVCKDIQLSSGWNMVSVPLQLTNMTASSVFPMATSQVYGFNNGYTTVSQLENAKGYWVRYGSTGPVSVCGNALTANVPVSAGWNMIGFYDADVPVTAIGSNPPSIINSVFYGFNNGYTQATVLSAGRGYWVRASQAGSLIVASNQEKANESIDNAIAVSGSLFITDASNYKTQLYFSNEPNISERLTLPPAPPAGIPDIRFANGSSYSNGVKANVLMQDITYPAEIRATGMDYVLTDVATNGKVYSVKLKANTSVMLPAGISEIEVTATGLPKEYSLEQNFPNPFNPSTTIVYHLPENSTVSLKLFDGLGNEVQTLVATKQAAGTHSVTLQAANLASGIYYYTLQAGAFRQSKKLLLLK